MFATFERGEIVIYWNSLDKLLEALGSQDTEENSWHLDCCAQYSLVCTQHNSNEMVHVKFEVLMTVTVWHCVAQ